MVLFLMNKQTLFVYFLDIYFSFYYV